MSRFKDFTEDELYMLKRQSIESSFNIMELDAYTNCQCVIHKDLMNEILEEFRRRQYNKE